MPLLISKYHFKSLISDMKSGNICWKGAIGVVRIRIKLSALLGDRRMKQKELAELTGISTATINHYYNETMDRISIAHLEVMCEVLHCRLNELLVMEIIEDDVSAVADLRWERETRRKSVGKGRR